MKTLNFKKQELQKDDPFEKHAVDLKEAVYQLPQNADHDTLIRALKAVYSDEGQYIMVEWLSECKLAVPFDFQDLKAKRTVLTHERSLVGQEDNYY